MEKCTCNQAISPEEIGQLAFFNFKKGVVEGYRFDQKCPVHRIITAVNGVPIEPRQAVEKTVDKPLTAREKRQKAHRAKREEEVQHARHPDVPRSRLPGS